MPTENRSSNTEMVIASPSRQNRIHIEVRKCEGCDHIGIDDAHRTLGACHNCDWSGPEPVEDKCPGCGRENVMAAACPDCGSRYVLATSKEFEVPFPQPPPDPIAWMVGTAFWWTKEEAERDAAEVGQPVVCLGPMADSGEVERLHVVIEQQRNLIASLRNELVDSRSIDASAEPSVPAALIPEGYCIMPRRLTAENGAKVMLLGEFKLEAIQECPECRELDEPVEGCEICDGEGEYGQRHIIPWDKIKYIYSEAVRGLAIHPKTTRETT